MVGTPACVRTGPGDGEQLVCWSVGGLTGSFLCSQVTEETMAYHPKPRGIHRCRLNAEQVDAERNPRLAFPQVLPPGTCSLFVRTGHPRSPARPLFGPAGHLPTEGQAQALGPRCPILEYGSCSCNSTLCSVSFRQLQAHRGPIPPHENWKEPMDLHRPND